MKTIRVRCSQVIHYDSVIQVTDKEWEVLNKIKELGDVGWPYNEEAYSVLENYLRIEDRADENTEYVGVKIS